MEKVQRVQSVRPEEREAQGQLSERHARARHRKARLMSNAQVWYSLIAGSILLLFLIIGLTDL